MDLIKFVSDCNTCTNINAIGLLNVTGSKYLRKLSALYLKIPVVLAGV